MFSKNHSTILIAVPSYFKLNPNKEEKITDVLSYTLTIQEIEELEPGKEAEFLKQMR